MQEDTKSKIQAGKDYYYILGVRPDATTEEIQEAYHDLYDKFGPHVSMQGMDPDILIKTFRDITEHTQDRAGLRSDFTIRVDEELTADPDQLLSLPELFFPLCAEMGIEPDLRKLPDAIIGMDPCTTYDPNPEISDDDPDFNPIPRATSPP